MSSVALAFLPKPLLVHVDNVLASRKLPEKLLASHKYHQIRHSIQEIDLIEPLSVAAVDRKTNRHLLLDGHLRLQAMKELGRQEVPCLVAIDDESFTYNNRVSRLSTIQEHLMIRRALDRGISAAKLANALCVDIGLIQKKNYLLEGICDEVIELLKDRNFSVDVAPSLRRMKPTRQIECAELMMASNTLTATYARALLAATPVEMLVGGKKVVHPKGLSHEQMARMETEMSNLLEQYKIAEQTQGEDIFNLMLARGYIVKLLDNAAVMRYLQANQAEVLEQFSRIVEMTSIDG